MNLYTRLKNISKRHRFARYVFSGALTVFTEYFSFIVIYKLIDLDIIISNSISLLLALMVNFALNRYYVFKNASGLGDQIFKYLLVFCVNLVISGFIVYLFSEIGTNEYITKTIAMIFTLTWTYILFSKIVFINKEDK